MSVHLRVGWDGTSDTVLYAAGSSNVNLQNYALERIIIHNVEFICGVDVLGEGPG